MKELHIQLEDDAYKTIRQHLQLCFMVDSVHGPVTEFVVMVVKAIDKKKQSILIKSKSGKKGEKNDRKR